MNSYVRMGVGNVQFTLELKKAITQGIQGTRSHHHFSYRVLYYRVSLFLFQVCLFHPRVTATLSLLNLFSIYDERVWQKLGNASIKFDINSKI